MAEDEAYYRSQARGYEAQAEQKRVDRRLAEAKLERLRAALAVVSADKGVIKAERDAAQRKADPPEAWKGARSVSHQGYVSYDLRGVNAIYYSAVDTLHDALIARITALENEVMEYGYGITWLAQQANNLWSWIRRNFN
jgi:hypothetical protein